MVSGFLLHFFQVEKLTKWLTHKNWWRNCAYANFLLRSFTLELYCFEISFQKNGMNSLQPQL